MVSQTVIFLKKNVTNSYIPLLGTIHILRQQKGGWVGDGQILTFADMVGGWGQMLT
jgi:hypothetical protein